MSQTIDMAPKNKPAVDLVKRPWGFFKQFAHNKSCTVSLMSCEPGQRLSLQSHTRRSELWIIIDDGAIVQVGNSIKTHRAGDEVWIPAKKKHRLSCSKDLQSPVRVLEVAFGNWQQDDIMRYEDDYDR